LVNMDLPWNPALLEQRIARIHRMGQKRPVQIINFVAKGTIEEGMLSVLAFKRSLSAGILDGGTGEISLGGSRLNRFMKDVENVTGHMGDGETVTAAEESVGGEASAPAATAAAVQPEVLQPDISPTDFSLSADTLSVPPVNETPAPPAQPSPELINPWQALAQVGAQLVSALGAAGDPAAPAHPWIERDAKTGVQNLKVPLPPPEMAGQIADALSMLANALRGTRH
jgi:hypothetical protein